METPRPLWAACASVFSPLGKKSNMSTQRVRFTRKGWGSWACSALRCLRGDLISIYQNFQGACQRMESGSSQVCQAIGKGTMARNWCIGSSTAVWKEEELPYCAGDHTPEHIVQRGCGASITGGTREPSGHNPMPCALGTPCWAGGWTRWPLWGRPQSFRAPGSTALPDAPHTTASANPPPARPGRRGPQRGGAGPGPDVVVVVPAPPLAPSPRGGWRALPRPEPPPLQPLPRPRCRPARPSPAGPSCVLPWPAPVASPRLLWLIGRPGPAMADFDEIYEEEEDEERALEEQLLKYSPDPVVVRGSGHVTV